MTAEKARHIQATVTSSLLAEFALREMNKLGLRR
jgi:hypothetical protein